MKVTVNTPKGSFKDFAANAAAEAAGKVIDFLADTGERAVEDMRLKGSYVDRSGNLRSSTGYVVAVNGEVVRSGGFAPVSAGGVPGAARGKAYAESIVSRYPDKTVLILVAGMEYAEYVQDKGFNVTMSGELLAERLLSSLAAKPERP